MISKPWLKSNTPHLYPKVNKFSIYIHLQVAANPFKNWAHLALPPAAVKRKAGSRKNDTC
jgi:hypothetical protein